MTDSTRIVLDPRQQLIIDTVRRYVGCSLLNRRDELADLIVFPGDEPEQDVQIKTNCAMFVLGIWRAVGVDHPLLQGTYKSGMAMAWVLEIASDLEALRHYGSSLDVPPPGSVMHYANAGKNNDHVEFCLSEPNSLKQIDHAGAGRTNNAVTESSGPWSWNYGRPLVNWIDPTILLGQDQ